MRVLLMTVLIAPALADDPIPVDGDPPVPCFAEWSEAVAVRVSADPTVPDPCDPWSLDYWDGAELCVFWCGSDLIETVAVLP
jgi:hypothetical protein